MKTLRLISLVCATALALSGCALMQTVPSQNSSTIDGTKYQSTFDKYLQYQQLSSIEQSYYGVIYTSVRDNLAVETHIPDEDGETIPGLRISFTDAQLSMTQIARVFEAFYLDNPDLFFIDRTYTLEGREAANAQVYDTLLLRYTMNAAQRTTAIEAMTAATNNILKNRPITDDEYLIELYLHNALLTLCTYDETATESATKHPNAYTAYGALVEGKAVCEGYAKAMQWLLTSVSISTTVIRGYSVENQTGHMWNLVRINEHYYYLDPTWNDGDKGHQYSYFNITSRDLQRTHIIDSGSIPSIDCTADTDNYFVRNNSVISSYDRDAIADVIAAQIQQDATVIHLRFTDGKFENGLLFLKNAGLTKKMVNARTGPDKQMWDYTLHTNAKQNTLSLYKIEN